METATLEEREARRARLATLRAAQAERLISEFVAERTNRLVSWTMKKPTARARLLGHASPAAIAAATRGRKA